MKSMTVASEKRQFQNLLLYVDFLQKANGKKRQQIWKHETTIARQRATIQKLKAEQRAKNTMISEKGMKDMNKQMRAMKAMKK